MFCFENLYLPQMVKEQKQTNNNLKNYVKKAQVLVIVNNII